LATRHEHLLRELAPQVLGAVLRRFRDFEAAEDAVQEALLAASSNWSKGGLPDNPRGWLIQVAARKITDHLRAELARRRRETVLAVTLEDDTAPAPDSEREPEREDTLLLLFMCCHPALTRTSAIALTLRAVAGLSTSEIAHAFLVPEATMAQRISRAKQLIKKSGAGFQLPTEAEHHQRLDAVLHVLYLIFNEGYASTSGDDLARVDLSNEALRLTRRVHEVLPAEPEVSGLLALMRLTDARRAARTGPLGELIPLGEQDRTAWDRDAIAEGVELLGSAWSQGAMGPYQLQAAIAACHDEASSTVTTDFPRILVLYELLQRISGDNPLVALNQAVAVAMVHGPAVALAQLEPLSQDARLTHHHRLSAVRGHLYEMSGELSLAVSFYQRAASQTASTPERDYLLMKAARLRDRSS
jgi:RNA polymerase sigma factor (sigma-70 family)